jgi:uncharacterized protein
MLRLMPAKLAVLDPTSMTGLGHLLETFVVGELRKQAAWLDDVGPVGHWRTSEGDDIDLIVERDDSAVVAFEVRTAPRVSGDDFKGLRKLRDALGDQFLAGGSPSTLASVATHTSTACTSSPPTDSGSPDEQDILHSQGGATALVLRPSS